MGQNGWWDEDWQKTELIQQKRTNGLSGGQQISHKAGNYSQKALYNVCVLTVIYMYIW